MQETYRKPKPCRASKQVDKKTMAEMIESKSESESGSEVEKDEGRERESRAPTYGWEDFA